MPPSNRRKSARRFGVSTRTPLHTSLSPRKPNRLNCTTRCWKSTSTARGTGDGPTATQKTLLPALMPTSAILEAHHDSVRGLSHRQPFSASLRRQPQKSSPLRFLFLVFPPCSSPSTDSRRSL